MRMLSQEELDEVFAGDGRVSATLPSVTVTGQHFTSSSTPFPYGGSSWAGPTMNEGGGYCYQGAGSYFALSWDSTPDMNDVRCEVNKAADPGMGVPATASVWFVNDYAFKDPSNGNIVHLPTDSPPAGHHPIYAQADSAHNGIYMYAASVMGLNFTESYKDPATGVVYPPWQTNMTGKQHAILVLAHEAAHGHGITDELLAEGYAVNALKRFREAGQNQCP